ncbi:MAG TPA: sensor histidine kinase [Dongiaceae bacterium]|nr:sensor histidine kinase [Dongiaceae bacterium]
MLVIFAASVIAVSAPAALVFYWFTREAAIKEAEQFVESSLDRRILGLTYTIRLAGASLSRFNLMLLDRLAAPPVPGEVERFAAGLEPNPGGMPATRRSGFNGHVQAGVVLHPGAPRSAEIDRFHARTQRLMSLYAGAMVPPLDSMWLLTRDQTTVIYVPRDPDFIYNATTGNNYLETEWVTLGDPAVNPKREVRWTHASYDPILRTWMVSAVLPFDVNGAWVGNLGHDLFLDEVTARLIGTGEIEGTEHFLVDSDGAPIIAGRWQQELRENRLTDADRTAFKETIATLHSAFAAAPDIAAPARVELGGTSYSVLMRTVPETGWQYYVATPISGMVGGASRALLLFGVTAVIAIVLVAAVTHVLMRRQIIQPVRALAATVRSFAAGDPQARTTIDRDDDIGDLGRAFNAMADRISAAHDDLTLTQEELQHRNTALLHANRTKSNFLANMSHELRTPLNAIIGFAEILRHQMFGPLGSERYSSYVNDIQRSGQHLLSLINDVLDMSRIEAGRQPMKLEQQPLRPLIERSMRMTQPMAENRAVRLDLDADGFDLSANCDSRAVIQMVVNLVSNAIKFSPPGGAVNIRLQASELGGAKISVADTGPGIDEGVLPHLFEAYAHRAAMTTSRYDGVGLGLAITKALIELHHGHIHVVTQPGRGTIMTLELPPTLP